MKVRGDFLGPPRSTDKTTLIIKVSTYLSTYVLRVYKQQSPGETAQMYRLV